MADFDLDMAIRADGSDAKRSVQEIKDELNQLGPVSQRSAAAGQAAAKSTRDLGKAADVAARQLRGQATAQRMVGVQINDFATQVSLGASPMQAFAAQAGQVGFAMGQMGGKFEKVGNFIAGPWGAAILIAGTVLGPLVAKMFEGEDAATKLANSLDIQKMSLEELTKALDESNKKQEAANRTSAETQRFALSEALARGERTLKIREETVALLEQEKAKQRMNRGTTGGPIGGVDREIVFGNRIRDLEADLVEANAAVSKARTGLRLAVQPIATRASEERADPQKRLDRKFEDEIGRLNSQLRSGAVGIADHARQLDAINVRRRKETELLKEQNKKPPRAKEAPVTPAEVRAFLASEGISGITSGKRTVKRNREVGGDENSYHLGDQAIDFTNVPGGLAKFDKAARRRLEARAAAVGIKLLENLGPGDKGHADHGHIAFSTNRLSGDQRITEAAQARAAQERDDARAAQDAKQLADFGVGAGDKISGFGARFEEGSKAVIQAREQLEDLDRLLEEIAERKPPNFETLIDQGQMAREVIKESIQKPFRDFIADQEFAAEQARLLASGREDEAEALRIIRDLNRENATLLPEQEAAVRAIIAARREEAREAEIARQRQQSYLDAVSETKDAVRAIFDGTGEGLKALPGRLLGAVEKVVGDNLFDNLFGDFFRDLEDQANGTTVVKDASQKMADAIDVANRGIANLATAAQSAANKLAGIDPLAPLPDSPSLTAPAGAVGAGDGMGTATVTGPRRGGVSGLPAARSPADFFGGAVERLARKVGIGGTSQGQRDAQVAKALKDGVQIKPDVASKLGAAAGKGMAGFATGSMVDGLMKPLGKALGFKTSKMGAQIGGAAGAFLPIPFGKEIGAVVGSVIGGLFKKTKKGSATITNVFDDVQGTGNFKAQTSAMGTALQGSLMSIAEQLGGGLGSFAVSIGKRKDKFVVDPTGQGRLKTGVQKFDSEDDAIRAALMDAIRDGAITGLSAAVTKAIGSSSDVDRALREALKVQDLEYLLAGTGAEFEKTFRQFENIATERTRLAKKYGFDLVKLEEITGKQRADILEGVIRERVGALQDLVKDLNFGDLFEGTLVDQRSAILGEIRQAQTGVEAGEEGAAAQLANLQRRLLAVSRDAYGTAGPEYSGDLAATRQAAEAAIALETTRAREAQERAIAGLNASTQQVTLQNETNNILAEHTALLRTIAGREGPAAAGSGGTRTDFSTSSRFVNLQ